MIAQGLRFDIKLTQQLVERPGDARFGGHQFPHPGARGVQPKVALAFQVQQDRFAVKVADEHMRRHHDPFCRLDHSYALLLCAALHTTPTLRYGPKKTGEYITGECLELSCTYGELPGLSRIVFW